MVKQLLKVTGLIALGAIPAAPAYAELSAEELAMLAKNPVGKPISVLYQNNSSIEIPMQATAKLSAALAREYGGEPGRVD